MNKNVNNKINKYISSLIFRLLFSIMLFFSIIIISNYNTSAYKLIKYNVLDRNMDLTKLNKITTKYFKKYIPVINSTGSSELASSEIESEYEPYLDGYMLNVGGNYPISALNSGIVVFIGEKENYGKTVIVQGINEIDYWYCNINIGDIKLYDYVKKDEIIGETNDNLILLFQKNGEFLNINEIGN